MRREKTVSVTSAAAATGRIEVVLVAIVVGSFRINMGGWGTNETCRMFQGDELIFFAKPSWNGIDFAVNVFGNDMAAGWSSLYWSWEHIIPSFYLQCAAGKFRKMESWSRTDLTVKWEEFFWFGIFSINRFVGGRTSRQSEHCWLVGSLYLLVCRWASVWGQSRQAINNWNIWVPDSRVMAGVSLSAMSFLHVSECHFVNYGRQTSSKSHWGAFYGSDVKLNGVTRQD